MGLDQYLYKRKNDKAESEEDNIEIGYWRKYFDLQGFMEKLWEKRGKPDAHSDYPEFNCVEIELTREDCLEVIQASKDNTLPATTGFFFGSSIPEDNKMTIEFMQKAIEAIDEGYHVYYDSWW